MRFKIDWGSLQWEGNLPFLLHCLTLYSRANSKYKYKPPPPTPEAYIRRDDLTEGLLRYDFGGLGAYIWRGLYMEGLIFGILRYSTCKNESSRASDKANI